MSNVSGLRITFTVNALIELEGIQLIEDVTLNHSW